MIVGREIWLNRVMKLDIQKYHLDFRFEAGTSRGVMTSRDTYFLKLYHPENPEFFGIGECGPLNGLSPDLNGDLLSAMAHCITTVSSVDQLNVSQLESIIPNEFPALQFALETAILDFNKGGSRILFDNKFCKSHLSIPINGLVWMGDKELMMQRLISKIDEGFQCIKIKIGGIHFEEELALLGYIRSHYTESEITIRLDANGAFKPQEALKKLDQLSKFNIHSIEQPIMAGDWESMRKICNESPIPIALDEELIGISGGELKMQLLETIKPNYIILKPTLLGGLDQSKEWIALASELGIRWWVTSALESNIGLNAIAQFVSDYPLDLPQGLGTGQLYHNNIGSPLEMDHGYLRYNANKSWDLNRIYE